MGKEGTEGTAWIKAPGVNNLSTVKVAMAPAGGEGQRRKGGLAGRQRILPQARAGPQPCGLHFTPCSNQVALNILGVSGH